jgi:hypothetical protein
MKLLLAVLLALVGVTVAWDTKKAAACVIRINKGIQDKSLDPETLFKPMGRYKSFVYDQCMAQNWLVSIYHTDNKRYKIWAKKEQLKVGLEDVMLRDSLKKCLQKYAKKGFWDNELQFILDSFKLMRENPKDKTGRTRACEILDVYGFEAAPKEANLAYKKRIKLIQNVMPKVWGEIKVKYNVDSLQKKEKKAALKLAHQELVKYDKKKKGLCLADPAQVDAKQAFKEGYEDVKSMIVRGGFPTFWGSDIFKECKNAEDVARDLGSFSSIQSNFCKDESTTYFKTPEDKTRKQATINAIQQGWKNKCKENPDFDPKKIELKRVQAPVRDEMRRNNRQKPMPPRTPKVQGNGKAPPPPPKKKSGPQGQGLPKVNPSPNPPPVPNPPSKKKSGPPPSKKGLPKVNPPPSPRSGPKPPAPGKKSGPPRRKGNPKAPPRN